MLVAGSLTLGTELKHAPCAPEPASTMIAHDCQAAGRTIVTKPIATIDEYIRSSSVDVQLILEEVRRTIREAAPAAGETIAYQMPTFTLDGKYLVHFAAWKNYISLYPTPTGDPAFEQEIAPYRAAKSTVRFPLGKPIPYDLIGRLVSLRVQQRLDHGE